MTAPAVHQLASAAEVLDLLRLHPDAVAEIVVSSGGFAVTLFGVAA